MHLPGVLNQQVKHPLQCPIFLSIRNTFSVSAPPRLAPRKNASPITLVLLLTPAGLPLNIINFINIYPFNVLIYKNYYKDRYLYIQSTLRRVDV